MCEEMNKTRIEAFAKIVGVEGLRTGAKEMAPFLKERRGLYEGSCLAVVAPATTTQVSEVVRYCFEHDIPITPQSGNTGLCGGAVPHGGILLNLGRMNTIRDLDSINATMTVDAGCILEDLQVAAESENMLFSLSAPSKKECQIGGNISTNLGGTNVLKYGNTRDVVLGLEVVLPDGEIWHGLRALRKDNAGYDLKHLYIGAEGTLGVITAATLKLYPAPKVQQTALVATGNIAELMEVFVSVRNHFAENLTGFEIISRNAINVVLEYDQDSEDPFTSSHAWYGLIELNSTDSKLDLETPLDTVLEVSGFEYKIAKDETESAILWNIRNQISAAQKIKGASIKHDVSLPLNRLADFITKATHLVEEKIPGVIVCSFGHAGDGNVHFNLTQPENMDGEEFLGRWGEVNRLVHDVVDQMNGSIAAEHGVGQLKVGEMSRYKSSVELELMRKIKKTLDPKNICNPGKVIA
ncbi:MAG: FAD/FMN-containing dehydrogenase [Desulforhopalus sp.]|jgi:FAD/FMN-containing dehydrogenase